MDLAQGSVSVFGVKASVHDNGWGLLRPGHPIEVIEEGVAQQVVSFLNRHASLPQSAILHMDAGKAALLAVQDPDFCTALTSGYRTPKLLELNLKKVAFRTKEAMFRVQVRIRNERDLLEVRAVDGKVLRPLS